MDTKTKNLIKQALRKASLRWSVRGDVLRESKVYLPRYRGNGELSKQKKVSYRCAGCKKLFRQQEVEVDHIKPVGSDKKGWDSLIENMFCDKSNLQVLCKHNCHKKKTKKDTKEIRRGNLVLIRGDDNSTDPLSIL